jgi:hypothetical protein
MIFFEADFKLYFFYFQLSEAGAGRNVYRLDGTGLTEDVEF